MNETSLPSCPLFALATHEPEETRCRSEQGLFNLHLFGPVHLYLYYPIIQTGVWVCLGQGHSRPGLRPATWFDPCLIVVEARCETFFCASLSDRTLAPWRMPRVRRERLLLSQPTPNSFGSRHPFLSCLVSPDSNQNRLPWHSRGCSQVIT